MQKTGVFVQAPVFLHRILEMDTPGRLFAGPDSVLESDAVDDGLIDQRGDNPDHPGPCPAGCEQAQAKVNSDNNRPVDDTDGSGGFLLFPGVIPFFKKRQITAVDDAGADKQIDGDGH